MTVLLETQLGLPIKSNVQSNGYSFYAYAEGNYRAALHQLVIDTTCAPPIIAKGAAEGRASDPAG